MRLGPDPRGARRETVDSRLLTSGYVVGMAPPPSRTPCDGADETADEVLKKPLSARALAAGLARARWGEAQHRILKLAQRCETVRCEQAASLAAISVAKAADPV